MLFPFGITTFSLYKVSKSSTVIYSVIDGCSFSVFNTVYSFIKLSFSCTIIVRLSLARIANCNPPSCRNQPPNQYTHGFVYEADYATIREFNAQLGKIASNVNQIAKRANETHHIYKEDMEEIKRMMEKIWHIQKSILSQQPFIKR